jgi:hypothetical protein
LDTDDVIVALLLVHGSHDLANLGLDERVITLPPIKERIMVSGGCVEMIWAAHRHHARIVLN